MGERLPVVVPGEGKPSTRAQPERTIERHKKWLLISFGVFFWGGLSLWAILSPLLA